MIEAGKKNTAFTAIVPDPDDYCMFSYTSGTTGNPKGVQLSHKMLLASAESLQVRLSHDNLKYDNSDSYLSYLPSAHSFEQILFALALVSSAKVGYFGGDPKKLKMDIELLKPTRFCGVPRVFNLLYGRIKDKFDEATGCKAFLIKKAIATKLNALQTTGAVTNGCWDKIIFKKVYGPMFGGRPCKNMITGSAPISNDVLNFLKIVFCCNIAQGYGMTETCAGSCCQMDSDRTSGNCGGPVANVKFMLKSIPEMNCDANPKDKKNPQGELMIAGSSVMKGYFKNPEKTKEMMPDGKWLLTGDVAEITENGALKIIGRAKDQFKLSQGEYIAPEKLENVYTKSSWILQCWIHGDSLHDWLLLFAVLDPEKVKAKWGENANLEDSAIINEILADVNQLAKEAKFNSLEKPKQIKLFTTPWTENDILTPTFKLKRNVAAIKYKDDIEKLYKKGPLAEPGAKPNVAPA